MVCKSQGRPLSDCIVKFNPGDTSNATSHLKDRDVEHLKAYNACVEKKEEKEVSVCFYV
jgi:hypothetical protein